MTFVRLFRDKITSEDQICRRLVYQSNRANRDKIENWIIKKSNNVHTSFEPQTYYVVRHYMKYVKFYQNDKHTKNTEKICMTASFITQHNNLLQFHCDFVRSTAYSIVDLL